MMGNLTISHFCNDPVQEKKMEGYGFNRKNFLAGQELTVTITLEEYRDLIKDKAVADEKNLAYQEVKKEADRLKAENYDLQNKIMEIKAWMDTTKKQSQESGETE